MTDDEIKAECERRFQNGQSRTQVYGDGLFASYNSVDRAKSYLVTGERIFSRRKTTVKGRTKYVWK